MVDMESNYNSLVNSGCLAYFKDLPFNSLLLQKENVFHCAVENLSILSANILSIYGAGYPDKAEEAIKKSVKLFLTLIEEILNSHNKEELIIKLIPDLVNRLYINICEKIKEEDINEKWEGFKTDLFECWKERSSKACEHQIVNHSNNNNIEMEFNKKNELENFNYVSYADKLAIYYRSNAPDCASNDAVKLLYDTIFDFSNWAGEALVSGGVDEITVDNKLVEFMLKSIANSVYQKWLMLIKSSIRIDYWLYILQSMAGGIWEVIIKGKTKKKSSIELEKEVKEAEEKYFRQAIKRLLELKYYKKTDLAGMFSEEEVNQLMNEKLDLLLNISGKNTEDIFWKNLFKTPEEKLLNSQVEELIKIIERKARKDFNLERANFYDTYIDDILGYIKQQVINSGKRLIENNRQHTVSRQLLLTIMESYYTRVVALNTSGYDFYEILKNFENNKAEYYEMIINAAHEKGYISLDEVNLCKEGA